VTQTEVNKTRESNRKEERTVLVQNLFFPFLLIGIMSSISHISVPIRTMHAKQIGCSDPPLCPRLCSCFSFVFFLPRLPAASGVFRLRARVCGSTGQFYLVLLDVLSWRSDCLIAARERERVVFLFFCFLFRMLDPSSNATRDDRASRGIRDDVREKLKFESSFG